MEIASGYVPSALAALAVVVGLIWLAASIVRTTGIGRGNIGGQGRRFLVLEETIMLDRSRRLHLVRCRDRSLILLTGGGTDVLVDLSAPGRPLVGETTS